jgi:hypothetical protein
MKKLILAAVLIAMSGTASAEYIYRYGSGVRSCGTFNKEYKEQPKGSMEILDKGMWTQWLLGFVSASGVYINGLTKGSVAVPETDVDGVTGYIKKYCKENPAHDVVDAATSLIVELVGE